MLTFIKAEERHLSAVLAIYNHYVRHSTATFSIQPIAMEEMAGLLFSGLERFPSYVIEEAGEVVGYVMMNRYKPREAYDKTAEVTLYLHPGAVGRGLGHLALDFIEETASGHGFHALLGVITAENSSSIALFEKHGYFRCALFKEVGEKFGRILDVAVYEKLLPV